MFGGKALCPGLDHEHFLVAGQSGQVIQHRQSHAGLVRGHKHGNTHSGGTAFRVMPVKADLAVTALVAGAALNDHTEIVNVCKNMVLIRPPVNLNSG
ncbi:MAG: hypothetical protein Tsb0027_02760 [Wenzhouxiangellaceae bacterium]